MSKNKKPDPADYLFQEKEEVASITIRVPAELKENFDEVISKREMTASDFFRGQMRWLIDLEEFEKTSKRNSK